MVPIDVLSWNDSSKTTCPERFTTFMLAVNPFPKTMFTLFWVGLGKILGLILLIASFPD